MTKYAFAQSVSRAVALAIFLTVGAPAQISHIAPPVAQHPGNTKFADLTSSSADPADATCVRYAAGSTVAEPPALSSVNGKLEVTFYFQTATDAQGLKRYCYGYTDGSGNPQWSPTLHVNAGDELIIHFNNALPVNNTADSPSHMMMKMKANAAVDSALPADCQTGQTPTAASANLHFHGTNVAPVCHQDEVINTIIPAQTEFDYDVQIPANEPPGLYWYHPHPHGYSDGQVIGGASGALIVDGIENINTAVSGLPERTFVLRDQKIPASESGDPSLPATDLSVNYIPVVYPSYTPAVVQTPQLSQPEQEFWRVLNASSDTVLDIQLLAGTTAQNLTVVSVDGVPLTDGSNNAITTTATDYVLAPGARVEFIVTTPPAGATWQLATQAWNNGMQGDSDPGRTLANITAATGTAPPPPMPLTTTPTQLSRFVTISANTPENLRKFYFSFNGNGSNPQFYITEDILGAIPAPFDPSVTNVTLQGGVVEQWRIENRTQMDHAFHIHQLHFQTIANNDVPVTDPTRRDTVDVPHWTGSGAYPSVTLLMDFRDPNIVGTFVYHCHVLSHEDLGMMGSIQVTPGATGITLTASPSSPAYGAETTLKATVAPASGVGTPTGTATFTNGTTTLGTAPLDNTGAASLQTASLPLGAASITAAYSGDNSFASSTSSALAVDVTPDPTATALAASPASVVSGTSVTLTATVTVAAPGTGVPTGAVAFANGSAALGTAMLNSGGVATISTTTLPVGADSIIASYAGAGTFADSQSPATTVTVAAPPPDFTLGMSPASLSVADGASGSTTITLTPENGFSAATSFACSGLPVETTCNFSPATLTPSGAPVTTTMTVTTTGSTALSHPLFPRPGLPLYALVVPGLGLLGLAGRRKRLPASAGSSAILLALAFALASALSACGGGPSTAKSQQPTPTGTYPITVTATSGATTHTSTVNLTVTQ
jgi:FtsP/CotA-like multicopper oxidase with cupredoxin domain